MAAVLVQFGRLLRVVDYQRIDFRVYYAAVANRTSDLYDFRYRINGLPFTYPPAAALVLRPLTSINELLAERLFFTASLAMVVIFAAVCVRMLPQRPAAWVAVPLFVIFLVFMMPSTLTLRLGQINALIALLVVLDAVLLDHDSSFAGFGSGLAAALKVTPALAIVVFIATGKRRAAAVGATTYAAVTLIGALWYPSETTHYWTSVLWQTARVGNVKTRFNQRNPGLTRAGSSCADFSNSIRRVVSWLPGNRQLHTSVWLLLGAVVVGFAILRVRKALRRRNHLAVMTLISCATYAVSPITWGHHLFFLGPMALLTAGDGRSRVRVAAAVVAGVLILDPFEHGEGSFMSFGRVILCVVAVLFMPIDERQATYEPRAYAEHKTSSTTLLHSNTATRIFRRALNTSPHTANEGNAANA
ncbi:MAG: glycosyltransferase 87 family protein [Acidimicrobiales bacterium]